MTGRGRDLRIACVTGVLRLLRMVYPGCYRNDTDRQQQEQLSVWLMFFGDLPEEEFSLFEAAVAAYIENDESGFPPAPGQVRGWMRRLREAASPDTPDTIWEQVKKAASKSGRETAAAFAALPEDARDALGGTRGLREISEAGPKDLSYAEHRFMQKLSAVREKRKAREQAQRAFGMAPAIERLGVRHAEAALSSGRAPRGNGS